MPFIQQYLIPFLLGVGLSAACGLRVFLPLFALSLFARFGELQISPHFEWLSSWPAIIAFGSASLIEIVAYFVPWLDNFLDGITIPSSVIAGTLVLASTNPELETVTRWTIAIMAGGGTAGLISISTALLRAKSTMVSGGAANFIVASGETMGAAALSLIAVLLPLLAGMLVAGFLLIVWRIIAKRKHTP